jgi:hypothetical protein
MRPLGMDHGEEGGNETRCPLVSCASGVSGLVVCSLKLAPSPGDLAFGESHTSNAVLGCGCWSDGNIADCFKCLG